MNLKEISFVKVDKITKLSIIHFLSLIHFRTLWLHHLKMTKGAQGKQAPGKYRELCQKGHPTSNQSQINHVDDKIIHHGDP